MNTVKSTQSHKSRLNLVVAPVFAAGALVFASWQASGAASLADEVMALDNRAAQSTARTMTLPEIARRTMALHFGDDSSDRASIDSFAADLPVEEKLKQPAGVFVTLTSEGKTRACWGFVFPQHETAAQATVYATLGALTQEYRYPPVKRHEWRQLKPQVSVITGIEPLQDLRGQNPLRYGLMVRAGGKAGVLLPGEAADAYYQLVQCKLKAGIKSGESCQLYRLRVDIYD